MNEYKEKTHFFVSLLGIFYGKEITALQDNEDTIGLRNKFKQLLDDLAGIYFSIPLTFDEFKKIIMDRVENKPSEWRVGQAVFNYTDEEFGLARQVQFEDRVDCFYNDSFIDKFIEKAYEKYNINQTKDESENS